MIVNTKTLGVITAFTALAAALNLIKIPTPYLLYFSYQLGDIILVIAFLLLGLKKGFLVAVLNMIVSIAINPSIVTLIGGPYYLVSVLTMVLGVYIFEKLIRTRNKNKQVGTGKSTSISTILSILTRTIIMLPLDYYVFGFLVSLASGWSISAAYASVLAVMPLIIFYNITVPLYVVTISYLITDKLLKHFDSSIFADSFIKK
jgi:riboflavin transporter FmnP